MEKSLVPVLLLILTMNLLAFQIDLDVVKAQRWSIPTDAWGDQFLSYWYGWDVKVGGSGWKVHTSNFGWSKGSTSLHIKSPGPGVSAYAYVLAPAYQRGNIGNHFLGLLNYTQNYYVHFYFYLPTSNNHWIHVFKNRHIETVIDVSTTFTVREGGVNKAVVSLNTTTWYEITYWVEPANQTFYIDIKNLKTNSYVVYQQAYGFERSHVETILLGDNDKPDPTSNWGEAYWDDLSINFVGCNHVVFRLLAVERYFGSRKYMRSAQYLIQNLTQYTNWKNESWNGFKYTSYIHLLSSDPYASSLPYYRGQPTKENVENEIKNFLGQTGSNENKYLTIRIFYYCGHSRKDPSGSNVSMVLDKDIPDYELDSLLEYGDLKVSSCVLVILDTCYSERYITELAQRGRVILAACAKNERAWSHSGKRWSWFTGAPNVAYNSSYTGPLGIIGAIKQEWKADLDAPLDCWLSAEEIFRFANKTTVQFSKNQKNQGIGNIMHPKPSYGLIYGDIPVVMYQKQDRFYDPELGITIIRNATFQYNSPPGIFIDTTPWQMFGGSNARIGRTVAIGPGTSPLWTSYLNAPIISSAAIVDGIVFVGTASKNETGQQLTALNLKTGEIYWSFWAISSICSSPTVVGRSIYFGTDYPGIVYALDEATGFVRWIFEASTPCNFTSSPAVAYNRVFIGSSSGYIYALHQINGMQVWNNSLSTPITSSPAVENNMLFIGGSNGVLYALNATDGNLLWEFPTGGPITSTPAVADNMVFVGSSDGKVYAVDMISGYLIWDFPTAGPVTSSPAVDSEKGLVIIGSQDGFTYALDEYTGAAVWAAPTDPIDMSSPAISYNDKVYIGSTNGYVYCLNETDGTEIWSFQTFGQVKASPAITDEHIIIGSTNGTLYCFGPPFPVQDTVALELTVSGMNAPWGQPLRIIYTVANNGNRIETFDVTIYYFFREIWAPPNYLEPITIHTTTVTLAPGENISLTYDWYPPRLHRTFNLIVEAHSLKYELNFSNNVCLVKHLRLLSVPNGGSSIHALRL